MVMTNSIYSMTPVSGSENLMLSVLKCVSRFSASWKNWEKASLAADNEEGTGMFGMRVDANLVCQFTHFEAWQPDLELLGKPR